jgi:hypothetical protein
MYLPEPVLALVLAYVTDGQAARRALDGFRRDQRECTWGEGQRNRAGREWPVPIELMCWKWGNIRRLLDAIILLAGRGELEQTWVMFMCPDGYKSRVADRVTRNWTIERKALLGVKDVRGCGYAENVYFTSGRFLCIEICEDDDHIGGERAVVLLMQQGGWRGKHYEAAGRRVILI